MWVHFWHLQWIFCLFHLSSFFLWLSRCFYIHLFQCNSKRNMLKKWFIFKNKCLNIFYSQKGKKSIHINNFLWAEFVCWFKKKKKKKYSVEKDCPTVISFSVERWTLILQVLDSLALPSFTVREVSGKTLTFRRGSLKEEREGNILAMQKWFYFSTWVSQLGINIHKADMEKLDARCCKEFTI